MERPRLVAPIVTVVMDDGSMFEDVQTTNWDMLAYERYARAHKWPPVTESPIEFATFLAWHATKREGLTADMDYDAFTQAALSIETRQVVTDPTQEVPGEG